MADHDLIGNRFFPITPLIPRTDEFGDGQLASFLCLVYVVDNICTVCHNMAVSWVVELGDEFESEFDELHEDVRMEILALTRLLQQFGPQLGRPHVDTLNGSRHANMKELRFSAADGQWRVALAFDTKRKGDPARCGR